MFGSIFVLLALKPGSHRARDGVRTLLGAATTGNFVETFSFNSTSWQCPRWCPSNIGLVLAGSAPGADVVAKSSTCHDRRLSARTKIKIGDMSPTCPSRYWNVLAVSGGFSPTPTRQDLLRTGHRTLLGHAFLPWPHHVNWGFPVTSVGNSRTTTRPEASWRAQRRVTPEVTGLPRLLPRLAAAKQAEDYTILSQNTCSRSSNVSVLIKKGCLFGGKSQRLY